MDRFEEIETFVRVAETLSVTRAATQLRVAPSAVSRRVRDLEARLGAQLLQRTTRRMNLTDAGRTFYQRCLLLLAELEEAEAEAADAQAAISGTLRITMPLSLGLSALTDAVFAFMDLHPELVVHADLNDRRVDLVTENIDLAIRVGGMTDSSLIARRISHVHSIVCASPAFVAEYGRPETPDDLAALPALCYSNVAVPDLWRYTGPDGARGEVRVTPRMLATNGDVLRDGALEGLGIVLEPSFIVYRHIEDGSLVPLLTDHRWSESGIYAVYPPTRHVPARARAFVEFLAERIGPEPEWETCLRGR